MRITELKEELQSLITRTSDEGLLEDLLLEAKQRINATEPHEVEGLSKDDYEELMLLSSEPHDKDTISYAELKSSLSRWFTN